MSDSRPQSVAAIVLAAGSGTRFGGSKHTLRIGDEPLWARCVRILEEAGVEEVVVVGDVPDGVPGGPRRRDSVANGLSHVSSDWVLVHDAARPLVSVELVGSILRALASTDADGVIPAVPVTDTVKRVDGTRVTETVDRSSLVAVQTPQAFRTASLSAAHAADGDEATDDASLIERWGGIVETVPGDRDNIKVTYPEDLARLDSIVDGSVT